MHRNDGLNYDPDIGDGGRGFIDQNLPTTAGSVMASLWGNAVQQELVHLIEDVGITLEASGAADKVAGWVQLLQAIQLHTRKTGVWVDATMYGLSDGPAVLNENWAALNAAFAVSNHVYIPAGNYAFYSSAGNYVTIPEGGVLMGAGNDTILQPMDPSDGLFVCSDTTTIIRDLKFIAYSILGPVVATNFSNSNQRLIMENVEWDGVGLMSALAVGINIDATGTQDGKILLKNCNFIYDFAAYQPGLMIEATGDLQSQLIVEDCFFYQSRCVLGGANSDAHHLFRNCQYQYGYFHFYKCANTQFVNCNLDPQAFYFEGSWGLKFINTYTDDTFSNPMSEDYNGVTSKVFWIDTWKTGPTRPEAFNYKGVYCYGDITGTQVIAAGTSLLTLTNQVAKMARFDAYTGESVVGASTFTASASCDGNVRALIHVITETAITAAVDVYVDLSGGRRFMLSKSQQGGTNTLHAIDGNIVVNPADVLGIYIVNSTGGNINVLEYAAAPVELKTEIRLEGM